MGKLRSINTSIWCDTWFEDLEIDEKLLFLFLITNERTNMLGVYEISLKKMSFETGISKLRIDKIVEKFKSEGKILYKCNRIILLKFLKHQNYNFNMKKSAIDCYNDLPLELKSLGSDDLTRDEKGFESLCKGFGMVRKVEVETEYELESKLEVEDESVIDILSEFDFSFFWDLYDKKVGDKEKLKKSYDNLKEETKFKIFKHVEQYKLSQPDKKFRKNPSTYINQKSWNDEIITSTSTKQPTESYTSKLSNW
jgi:hypothetical protein